MLLQPPLNDQGHFYWKKTGHTEKNKTKKQLQIKNAKKVLNSYFNKVNIMCQTLTDKVINII